MKKFIGIILCAVLLLTASGSVFADDLDSGEPFPAEPEASDICGENVFWNLDENGTLTIFGSGCMDTYASVTEAPWFSVRASVTALIIEKGVLNIGGHTFKGFENLSVAEIPVSVTEIAEEAFGASPIAEVRYAGTKVQWDRISLSRKGNRGLLGAVLNCRIANIRRAEIVLSHTSCSYNGKERRPVPTVYYDGAKLRKGIDFTVSYKHNINAGTGKVVITGQGYYKNALSAEFTIRPVKLGSAALKYSSLPYSGIPRTQSGTTVVKATVAGSEVTLNRGKDYTISYKNNLNAGTATMIITGKGNYTGTIREAFEITKAPIKSASLAYTSKQYRGKALTPAVKVKGKYAGKLVTLTKDRDYTVSVKNNTYPGTATVTIRGKGNYTGTIRKTFTITPVPLKELNPGDIVDREMIQGIEDDYFTSSVIRNGDGVYQYINGRSYYDNPDVALSDLRYLKVLHYNFDHRIQVGEIIVNKAVAGNVRKVFRELFDAEYEINSMYLIDHFWTGDPGTSDDESCYYNNTSGFCYRGVTNGSSLSRHAYGMAIDINTQQNPYVWFENGEWRVFHDNARPYMDRSCGDPHVIVKGDICYNTFIKYGFRWGGEWDNPKDYQHFEI